MNRQYLDSPIGAIEILASNQGITHVSYVETPKRRDTLKEEKPSALTELCKQQLQEYFLGQRQNFQVPLDQQGTEFQRSVWQCLSLIPHGHTASYLEVAQTIQTQKQ